MDVVRSIQIDLSEEQRDPDGQMVETRYRLLETLRQYGMEKLSEAGEEADTRARHLCWCLQLSDGASDTLSRSHGAAHARRHGQQQPGRRTTSARDLPTVA